MVILLKYWLSKYRCNMGIVKNLNPVTVQSKE